MKDTNDMTLNELRADVARIVGWTRLGVCGQPDYGLSPDGICGTCPDYPNDLNAAWGAWRTFEAAHAEYRLDCADKLSDGDLMYVSIVHDGSNKSVSHVEGYAVEEAFSNLVCRALVEADRKLKETT